MSKAWVSVLSVVLGIIVGAGIVFMWQEFRPDDDPIFGYGAGLVAAVMVFILLSKLRGG
ncbi:MAG: hypothetical protein N3E37_03040 [Candidatus Micrarchaeota archaeon]|nr:hypothetical protein [Candidatus Micrarchaeota archaeon]